MGVATRQVVFYSNGCRLSAVLHIPVPSSTRRVPGIVVAGGFAGVKELRVPTICDGLAAAGFVALRFDYQGFGESEGTRWRLLPNDQVQNVRDAAVFLAGVDEVDASRLGVYGNGWGGAPAVQAAALDERLRCVVLTAAPMNGRRWLASMRSDEEWERFQRRLTSDWPQRVATGTSEAVPSDEIMIPDARTDQEHRKSDGRLTWRATLPLETAQAVLDFRPEEVVGRISPRAILFIHCEKDTLVPLAESEAGFSRAGMPKRLVVLKGAQHHDIYYPPGRAKAEAAAVNWFRGHLDV
ncbi:MAG: alpha/beta hydrolase [Candidatus Limnocylindrales bacterium]